MIKIIDPHLHLFDLNKGCYHWLKSENPPFWPDKNIIAKNFSEQDLTLSSSLTLAGFVHIEAGFDNEQPWREIAWLEDTCTQPFRSIAMLDITLPKALFSQQLDKLMHYQSVVGIRYILDDHALAILSAKNSQDNLSLLSDKKLSFELQMPLDNTPAVNSLITLLQATPDLLLCINHAGWPTLDYAQDNAQNNEQGNNQATPWLENLQRLAKFSQVFIKCSGYEMADRHYSQNRQHKIIQLCIENFGITRVMLASNFPLSLWHASYQDTWLTHTELPYSNEQLKQLCFSNAEQFYKF